mgnify:CR=1 FL=1
MKLKIKFLIMIVTSIFTASCNDEFDADLKQLDHSLVFGQRTLRQIRGQLLEANKKITFDLPNSAFDFGSTALLGRSSAFIISKKYFCNNRQFKENSSDEFSCECAISYGQCSGNLTSPSRITTASHCIFPLATKDACNLGVTFESSIGRAELSDLYDVLESSPPVPFGKAAPNYFRDYFISDYNDAWADEDGASDYEGVDNDLRSIHVEENPLLANRLFSLGLESWAHPSNGAVRQILRSSWTFSAPDVLNDGTLQLTEDLPMTKKYIGKDIAFLDACPLDENLLKQDIPISGDFKITKPGIFFDNIRITSYNNQHFNNIVEQKSHIFFLGSHEYTTTFYNYIDNILNEDEIDLAIVPLIDGPRGITNTSSVCGAIFTCDGSTNKSIYFRSTIECIDTNLDSLEGMSGGHILVKSEKESRLFEGTFQSWGILQSIGLDALIRNTPQADKEYNLWGPGVEMQDSSEYSKPVKNYVTTIHPFDQDDKVASRYELGFDPLNPVPLRSVDEVLPDCRIPPAGDPCIEYGGELIGNKFGDPPTDIPTLFVNPVYTDGLIEEVGVSTSPQAISISTPNEIRGYRLTCDSWIFKNKHELHTIGAGPGVAIGFVGSKSFLSDYPFLKSDGDKPVLGSLRIICAPWTSRPFTDNWQFLFWGGRKSEYDKIKSTHDSSVDFLFKGLTTSFEQRDVIVNNNPVSTVRPISMKTCPPNYLLKGFNVIYNNEDPTSIYIVGIESLLCVDTANNPTDTPKLLTVCLDPANISQSPNGCSEGGLIPPAWNNITNAYTINNIPFSLAQEIGETIQRTPNVITPVRCENDEVVNNIFIDGSDNQIMKQIYVGCIRRPNQPQP